MEEKIFFLWNRSKNPVVVFEKCGWCKAEDIDPRPTSNSAAVRIGTVWYHVEKVRCCAQKFKEAEVKRLRELGAL